MARPQRPSYLRSLSSSTQKDKPRLYVALYPRSSGSGSSTTCDAYHWALMIGPATSSREDNATRYHLVHPLGIFTAASPATGPSYLGENDLQDTPNAREILIRIAVAKVKDAEQTRKLLRSMSPRKDEDEHTCFTWVREAFVALHAERGCLKSYFTADDWPFVEKSAREYVKQKRLEGRFGDDPTPWLSTEIATFNAWENRETAA